jgi:hypothetical protein
MANTVITIEIATEIKAALVAVVPDGTTVYVDGVLDTPKKDEDVVTLPAVSVVVTECLPMQYRSVLRAFPVSIEAATWYPEDKAQINLYTIAQAVNLWLAEPSLTFTLSHWDALVIESPPERGIDGNLQFMRWSTVCNTRKV